jgi:hypothetical protein
MLVILAWSLDVLVLSNTKLVTTIATIYFLIARAIIVDKHMVVITIKFGKNIVENVLIDGRSRINICHWKILEALIKVA